MRAHFVKVYIRATNREITEKIEKLTYEAAIEKDNLVEMTVKAGYAFEMADDDDIVSGRQISFQFGFLKGVFSPVHLAQISDIKTRYAETVKLTIKALDLGRDMKKSDSNKIWKKVKASDIAYAMAEKWGLVPSIDETTRVYASYPQGNKTDFEFLDTLATKEKDGRFVFFVTDGELCFKRVDYKANSQKTFTYGLDILSFEPEYKDSQQSGAGSFSKVRGFDPMEKRGIIAEMKTGLEGTKLGDWDINGNKRFSSGELKERDNSFVNQLNKDFEAKENPVVKIYNAPHGTGGSWDGPETKNIDPKSLGPGKFSVKGLNDATKAGEKPVSGSGGSWEFEPTKRAGGSGGDFETPEYGRTLVSPNQTQGELDDISKKLKITSGKGKHKSGGSKVLMATLKIELDPFLKLGQIITMAGVAKRHQGNWFISKIKHEIGERALTTVELSKNGTSKSMAKNANKNMIAEVNKTVGYDVDGNLKRGMTAQEINKSGRRGGGSGGSW